MPQRSAATLMYRLTDTGPEVLLIHPGGPFWANKDDGAWSIPKGLYEQGEDALAAARREFAEETGANPTGDFAPLGDYRQPSGKVVTAFAVAGDLDVAAFRSNIFTMEWPPKSGRQAAFPEADRAEWFALEEAGVKITKGQRAILAALAAFLADGAPVTPR